MTDLREALEAILHEYRTAGHHGADGIDVIASIAIEALAATPKLSNDFRLATDQLSYAKGPYSYEYIAVRPDDCRWRIRDTNDNAVGSAATEVGAKAAVALLNFAANPPSPTPPAGAAEVRETLRRIIHDFPLRSARQSGAAEYLGTGWCDNLADALADALSAPVPDDGWRPTHRHIGRGTSYRVVAEGYLQTTALIGAAADDEHVTLYRGEDGRWWVRPTAEFNDGRFEPISPPPGQGEKP